MAKRKAPIKMVKSQKPAPEHFVAPPTTTAEENLVSAGQRGINRVWEYTQACIAIVVTAALIYCSIFKLDAIELKNAFFLIIGFYFSRTNHTAIGGVGKKIAQSGAGTRILVLIIIVASAIFF